MRVREMAAKDMFPKSTHLFTLSEATEVRLTRAAKIFLQEIREPDLMQEFRELGDKEEVTHYWPEEDLYFTKVSGYRIAWRPSGDDRLDVVAIVADKPLD